MDLALKNWLSGLRLLPMNFTCPIVLTVRLVTSRADISSGFPWLAHSFMNPRSFFLDEPTSGIDPLTRRNFWRQITALAARGTTIIITTHFMEEAEYCDRFMIQDNGHLLAIGSPAEIRQTSIRRGRIWMKSL